MRTVVLERHGAPDVLIERDVVSPEPGAQEIKVAVFSAGVNFADLLQRMGLYGSAPPLPYVPGFEVAGKVIQVGPSVKNVAEGDRVVGMVASGGYSEELCLPFSSVRKISANLDYSQAAALPVNYLTAWFSLFTMGNLQPGDRLLVHGGAGGVGMAAIQLALEHPVEIFTTVGSERKKEFLAKLGVDHVINYRKSEFVEYIRSETDDEGVEVILDGVGGKTLSNSYLLLAPLGRLISYGLSSAVSSHRKNWLSLLKAWGRTPRFAPLDLIGRNVGVFGFHLALLGSKQSKVHEAFDAVLHKAETGRVSPVLAAQFPLSASGAIQAHQYLHDRRNIGKVVLARQEELGKWA